MIYYLKIKIVTPTIIKSDQQKSLRKGIDYFEQNNKLINVVDWDEVFKNFLIKNKNEFLSYIRTRNILDKFKNLLKNNPKSIYYKFSLPLAFNLNLNVSNLIYTNVRSANNLPYIPGSSIKGAVDNVLLNYIISKESRELILNERNVFEKIFGNNLSNFLKYIQVTDAEFYPNSTKVYPSKITSVNSTNNFSKNISGSWKNQKKGSTSKFDDFNFVSLFECLDITQESVFRIKIKSEILDNYKDKLNKIKNLKLSDIVNNPDNFFTLINKYTYNHLKKEKDFFQNLNGEKFSEIVRTLDNLIGNIDEYKQNRKALIRLGNGVGFHSITGNWIFDTHIIERFNNGIGYINERKAPKTRRVFFVKEDDDYKFYPPGFLEISQISEDEYNEFIARLDEIRKQNFVSKKTNEKISLTNEQNSLLTSEQGDNENKTNEITNEKKVVPYSDKINLNAKIPAEVIVSGKPNIVRLLIENYSGNLEFELKRYNSEIEKGKYIYVEIVELNRDMTIKTVKFSKMYDVS